MDFENNIDQILDHIYLGNYIGAQELIYNNNNNINVIINFYKNVHSNINNIDYYHIPYSFKMVSIDECWIIIQKIIEILNIYHNKNILFCCKRGHHRSACGVILYMIYNNKSNYIDSEKYIKKIRKKSLNREGNMPIALRYYSKMINKIYV